MKDRVATAQNRVEKFDKFGTRHLLTQSTTVDAVISKIETVESERDDLSLHLDEALSNLHALAQEMDLREDPNFTPNESNDKLETGTAQGTSSTTMNIRSTQELNSGRWARVWNQSSMIEAQQNIIRKYQL
jgi:hypothetical protein